MGLSVEEYQRWDAVEAAAHVRSGAVTAAELGQAARALAAGLPALRAVADTRVGDPLARSRAADDTPWWAGALTGVPTAVKELLAFPGLPWTFGSRLFRSQPAPPDPSPYAQRLVDLGLDVLWSSTSSEFGLLGSTESALRGVTANPWGAGVSAAGSSGGSAALVAAGVVPLAHGNDAGGSLRVPASVNGVVGFAPSAGRAVASGPAGSGLAALVVDHVITRSVRDSALVLAATERTDGDAPFRPVGRLEHGESPRLRIGVLTDTLTGTAPAPEVRAALDATVALCSSLGHDVDTLVPPPVDGDALRDAFFTAAAVTVGQVSAMVAAARGTPPSAEEFEPFTLALADRARSLGPTAGDDAARTLASVGAAYTTVFQRCDVVLSPTLARVPWPVGTLAPDLDHDALVARTTEIVGYTPVHNAAGCPGISLPLQWHDGLPVGMHLAARPGGDATLLRLAFDLEAAAPWRDRRPDTTWLR